MPDKKSDKTTDDEKSSGGSKRLIIVGALCALIAGAGFVLGGRMSGGGEVVVEAAPAVEEEVLPVTTIDEIVELEPLNVNLADGHYLRLAVAIGIAHGEDGDAAEESSGHGSSTDSTGEPSIETAPASDLVLTTFAGRVMDDLAAPEGREAARNDLEEGLVGFYGDSIVSVLFTEFVMQ